MQKLIVGIGNPGERYEKTRHNVGFMIADVLASKIQIPNFKLQNKFQSLITNNQELILAKPQTFMNESGIGVAKLINFYHIAPSSLYVIHDDLDIKLGDYKIQFGKGPKQHNGVSSIEEELGVKEFWRVRVGIENRLEKSDPIKGEDYVLQPFDDVELIKLNRVIDSIVDSLVSVLNQNG